MSAANKYTDAWVCVDCYFAHHYGMTEHGGEWFAGESDTPADREPLALLRGFGLGDGTGENGEGSDTFSWRRCDGCGSSLGGTRYRLAIFERVTS